LTICIDYGHSGPNDNRFRKVQQAASLLQTPGTLISTIDRPAACCTYL